MIRPERDLLISYAIYTIAALVIAALCAAAALFTTSPAKAFITPSGSWRGHEDMLTRVLIAEADESENDWAAILWTLEHRRERYGESPSVIMRYSAPTKSNAKRPAAIRAITSTEAGRRGDQYRRASGYVAGWLRGHVVDPCPASLHWHGIGDSRPRWFEPIYCGATRNHFGRVRSKPRE